MSAEHRNRGGSTRGAGADAELQRPSADGVSVEQTGGLAVEAHGAAGTSPEQEEPIKGETQEETDARHAQQREQKEAVMNSMKQDARNQDARSLKYSDIKKNPISAVDPVRQAQLDVIDEAIQRGTKTWEFNRNSRYLLIVNTDVIKADLIYELGQGLARFGIHNVLIWPLPAGSADAIKLFEEQ